MAGDAGNLEAVSRIIRQLYPDQVIAVCGDNDEMGTGQRAATAAALACGGWVLLPEEAAADWNDVACAGGVIDLANAWQPEVGASEGIAKNNLQRVFDPAETKAYGSDFNVAKRFAAFAGGGLVYLYDQKIYLSWKGVRWLKDGGEQEVIRKWEEFTRLEVLKALEVPGDKVQVEAIKAAASLRGVRRTKDALYLAQRREEISRAGTDFDRNKYTIQSGNGYVIDLKTEKARKVLPSDLCLKAAGADYDPAAQCLIG